MAQGCLRLTGIGKAWADDLELRVDGVQLPAQPDTPIDVDQEFSTGSKITLTKLSTRQLETLVLTAKVWGFLKFHHPAVTRGTQPWDFALLRQLKIDVPCAPTIAGIRAGRDEILDCALKALLVSGADTGEKRKE